MTQIDWVTPFLQLDPCLQEHPSNWTEVLQDSMSRHSMTNPDKLKLVNYNRKYAIPKFSKCKILVGKIFTIQHALVKFVRLFHHQHFTLYGTLSLCMLYVRNTHTSYLVIV